MHMQVPCTILVVDGFLPIICTPWTSRTAPTAEFAWKAISELTANHLSRHCLPLAM